MSQLSFPIANSSKPMPAVGLGTWKAAPNVVGNAVQVALKAGYLLLDCAHVYGNEKEVGEAFKASKVKREDIWITSKLWNNFHEPSAVRPMCHEQIANLQCEYLDLYLIHWPVALKANAGFPPKSEDFISVPIIDTWREMEKLVDEGIVKNIGVSNFNISQLKELLSKCRIKPCVNQIEFHPFLIQPNLRSFCAEQNIHITAYSSLGSNDNQARGKIPNFLQNENVVAIAKKLGKTPAQILLRFVVQMGSSVIPKSTSAERIASNKDLNFEIPEAEMASLRSLDKGLRSTNAEFFWNGKTAEEFWGTDN